MKDKLTSMAFNLFSGLAIFLPFGYFIKGLTEPPNWFLQSQYYPWLTFTINEIVFVTLAIFFYFQIEKPEIKNENRPI